MKFVLFIPKHNDIFLASHHFTYVMFVKINSCSLFMWFVIKI